MQDFVLKEIKNTDIKKELEKIGFDKSYINKACDKFIYKNIKIYNLTPAQANILKQTALSLGADCASHREVITGKQEISDCILGASVSQIKKIADKLQYQPFGLKKISELLKEFANQNKTNKTKIVGILNLTENSFSDGGEYNTYEKAVAHLEELISDGADIIDIGAESTKPFSKPVPTEEQLEKIIPILSYIKSRNIEIPVSIDTRCALTAEACIKAGAHIINDVSGFDYDTKMADVISEYGVKIVIQHSKGTPETMQTAPCYENLMDEIYCELKKKINFALEKGIKQENIIVDPGIGFGKTRDDNFEIIKRIEELYGLHCPVMLGISRKSLLGMKDASNETKDIYTLALNALTIESKVDYIRVHNVKLHKTLLKLI